VHCLLRVGLDLRAGRTFDSCRRIQRVLRLFTIHAAQRSARRPGSTSYCSLTS